MDIPNGARKRNPIKELTEEQSFKKKSDTSWGSFFKSSEREKRENSSETETAETDITIELPNSNLTEDGCMNSSKLPDNYCSVSTWLITLVINCIPIVNIAMMLLYIFKSRYIEKKNWAKAMLIMTIILTIFSIVSMIILRPHISTVLSTNELLAHWANSSFVILKSCFFAIGPMGQ